MDKALLNVSTNIGAMQSLQQTASRVQPMTEEAKNCMQDVQTLLTMAIDYDRQALQQITSTSRGLKP